MTFGFTAAIVVGMALTLASRDARDYLGDKLEILQEFVVNLYRETRSRR